MDEPESLDDLLRPDEMTLRFAPGGLLIDGRLRPGDSLGHLRSSVDQARLVPEVPEDVRDNFDRLRKVYLYGLLEYELFTVADDFAYLVLEGAFRMRFLTYYDFKVPVSRKGTPDILEVDSFDALLERKRGFKLRSTEGEHDIPTGLPYLLLWARRECLLTGQRSRFIETTMSAQRNHAAHPTNYTLGMPVHAGQTLLRVAEIINKLWGASTPEGSLYRGPTQRWPRVAAVSADGASKEFVNVLSARGVDPGPGDWTAAVYLAAPEERLVQLSGEGPNFMHRPGFQATELPCELLWGPGPWEELDAHLARFEGTSLCDEVDYVDRLFVIRVASDRPDLARSPTELVASRETEGVWHIVRADHPLDAWCHVRDHRDLPAGESKDGCCPECPVTRVGSFESRAETERCLEALCGKS
jgi:hypothetical protein